MVAWQHYLRFKIWTYFTNIIIHKNLFILLKEKDWIDPPCIFIVEIYSIILINKSNKLHAWIKRGCSNNLLHIFYLEMLQKTHKGDVPKSLKTTPRLWKFNCNIAKCWVNLIIRTCTLNHSTLKVAVMWSSPFPVHVPQSPGPIEIPFQLPH
jgi:hypothetical protein